MDFPACLSNHLCSDALQYWLATTEYFPSQSSLHHNLKNINKIETFGSAVVQASHVSIVISLGTTISCDCYSIPSVIEPWSYLSTLGHAGLCWVGSVPLTFRPICIDVFPWFSLPLLTYAGHELSFTHVSLYNAVVGCLQETRPTLQSALVYTQCLIAQLLLV